MAAALFTRRNGPATAPGRAEIDPALVPNLADVAPDFARTEALNADGALWGVRWAWGLTAFAHDTTAFEEAPTSIQVPWDPAHEGRVSIRDDALQAVQIAALATGQNIDDVADLVEPRRGDPAPGRVRPPGPGRPGGRRPRAVPEPVSDETRGARLALWQGLKAAR